MSGCPHMFGHPQYVSMSPFIWMHLLYVWMPPVCLDAPICLDTFLYVWMPPYVWILPCIFGHPYVWMLSEYVWTPPYVWMPPYVWITPYVWKMFGCLLYIYNTKKACFVRLMGCPHVPHTFGHPHMFGCPHMF